MITVPRTGSSREPCATSTEIRSRTRSAAGGRRLRFYTDASGHYSFTTSPGTHALYVYGDNLPGLPAHWSIYQPGIDVSSDRVLDPDPAGHGFTHFQAPGPGREPGRRFSTGRSLCHQQRDELGAGLPDAQGSAYMNGDSATTDSEWNRPLPGVRPGRLP